MNGGYRHHETRRAARYATPGKLWWLGERDENYALGWTTDASDNGLAFVTSAGNHLCVGETLSISQADPRRRPAPGESVRVKRMQSYGPSLQLIACSRDR